VLRYFDSREAVLLQLLDAELKDWIAELERSFQPGPGTPRARNCPEPRAALSLATSLAFRPFVLGERSGDLPHHLARGIAAVGQVVAAGSENADAALDLRQDAQLEDISPR